MVILARLECERRATKLSHGRFNGERISPSNRPGRSLSGEQMLPLSHSPPTPEKTLRLAGGSVQQTLAIPVRSVTIPASRIVL